MNNEHFENGFVLLSRSIIDSIIFKNPELLQLWIYIIVRANHKKNSFSLKIGKGFTLVSLNRGQLIFGRKKTATDLGLNENKIYRYMQKLEKLKKVNIETNNQYSIVTVLNYDIYNDLENYQRTTKRTTNEQPTNNQRTTNEQPTNTYNNDNNYKNVYNGENSLPADKKKLLDIFLNYKNEIKKPLKEISINYLIKEFETKNSNEIEEALNFCIMNGRENLTFEKKEKSSAKKENIIKLPEVEIDEEAKYKNTKGW